MNANLLAFTLAAMEFLAPDRDHSELSTAIAETLDAQEPFFADDENKTRSAAYAVAIAFRESSLTNDILGDRDQSACAFQIHLPGKRKTAEGWTKDDLRTDPHKCTVAAFRMIRESFTACRRLPVPDRLAVYARGRCDHKRGRQLSRDRYRLAKRVHDATLAAIGGES